MIGIINRLLEKRGLKLEELDSEEKKVFDGWHKILSGGEITVKSISSYCENNLKIIEGQFKNIDTPKEKLERLVLQHAIYSSLLGIINNPQSEKEALERYLESLL